MGGALQFSTTSAPAGPPASGNDNPADPFDPFEDYRRRGGMRCPHCRHIGNRRTSQQVTPLYWDIWYVCSHPGCGHTWKAGLSYVHGLSPSACPSPEFVDLPIKPMSRDDVIKPEPPPPDDPRQPRFFD